MLMQKLSATKEVSMVGTLDSWPLIELLSWLHQGNKTALVRIGEGLSAGMVFFSEGFLYRAEWGGLHGEQALFALLSVRQGPFAIMHRAILEAQPNVRTPTGELLLRFAIARDEMSRAPASA